MTMERKIGEIFEYNGEWYQCITDTTDDSCNNCFFQKSCSDITGDCSSIVRSDGESVAFKKLKKVGDPYLAHDHSRNKDVVVQDYKLYNQHACYNGHEEMLSFGLRSRNEIVTIKSKEPIKSLNCENSVEIQIEQNKEDIEENKLNLKPFDLEKTKAGKPVCTRDGRKVKIICFNAKRKDEKNIIALVPSKDYPGFEDLIAYPNNGNYYGGYENDGDLMMLPEKKEGWVNVYKERIYSTKEEAIEATYDGVTYVDTIKVEWEEQP